MSDATVSSDSLSSSGSGRPTHSGALRLLDDLDELASLLGTDLRSSPKPSRTTRQSYSLSPISSLSSVSSPPSVSSRTTKVVTLDPAPSTRKGELFTAAVDSNRLDVMSGFYTPAGGSAMRLADALETDLVNADSAAFVNPDSGEVTDLHTAIQHGYLQTTGHYLDAAVGKRRSLKECLRRSIVVSREVTAGPEKEEENEDDVVNSLAEEKREGVIEVSSQLCYVDTFFCSLPFCSLKKQNNCSIFLRDL